MKAVMATILFSAILLLTLSVECQGGSGTLSVSATILSKSNCRFTTATGTLNFGNINSAGSTDVSTTASLSFVCRGSSPIATFMITDDGGINGGRMEHTTLGGNFLPYQLSYTPTTASVPRNAAQTLNITGIVRSSDYKAAVAGAYSDTVILSINP